MERDEILRCIRFWMEQIKECEHCKSCKEHIITLHNALPPDLIQELRQTYLKMLGANIPDDVREKWLDGHRKISPLTERES